MCCTGQLHLVYVHPGLPVAQRDFLEKVQSFLPVPLSWLYLLPAEANNAAGALFVLAQLPVAERLPSLHITVDTPIAVINALQIVTLCQIWSSAEQEVLRAFLLRRGIFPRSNTLNNVCETWSDLTTSGEQLLQARISWRHPAGPTRVQNLRIFRLGQPFHRTWSIQ